jgi:excisionase family DNA binding protein
MATVTDTDSALIASVPAPPAGTLWRDQFAGTFAKIAAAGTVRTAELEAIAEAAERGARSAVIAGDEALLDAGEVAAILNVTEDRVWALTRDHTIPHVKLGGRTYRYRRSAVLAAVESMER